MWLLRSFAFAASALVLSISAYAQAPSSAVPRNETLIVENPEGTIKNAGWFNIWAVNARRPIERLTSTRNGYVLVHRPGTWPKRRVG